MTLTRQSLLVQTLKITLYQLYVISLVNEKKIYSKLHGVVIRLELTFALVMDLMHFKNTPVGKKLS